MDIVNSILADALNPMAAANRDIVQTVVKERQVNVPVLKAKAIAEIAQLRAAAVTGNASAEVLAGYDKCIAELNGQ